MVATKIITSIALFAVGIVATPLERRQNPLCVLDPTVANAVSAILKCVADITDPATLGNCALEAVRGLTNAEITCIEGILSTIPGLPALPAPL